MIYVGVDDTDMPDTPGTNQLARALVARVAGRFRCRTVVRHQLLDDPRVPYTSKNGSASILLDPVHGETGNLEELIAVLRARMLEWYVPGSDPGLCVTTSVTDEVVAFGRRCQHELVTRADAENVCLRGDIFLEGLGGTCGGVIGALAAVGLVSTGNDGRVVVIGEWPDDLSGPQSISTIIARNIVVRSVESGADVLEGRVDVGKHLRPNLRQGRVVLFVEKHLAADHEWKAVRFL